jgi:hypothetical protein
MNEQMICTVAGEWQEGKSFLGFKYKKVVPGPKKNEVVTVIDELNGYLGLAGYTEYGRYNKKYFSPLIQNKEVTLEKILEEVPAFSN